MKKTAFILVLLVLLTLICSCEDDSYKIGDVGPAGGYIFYDCDADNRDGNEDGLKSKKCGWRYLEVASEDVTVGSDSEFAFGYYRTSANGNNLYVNGTSSHSWSASGYTDERLGKGNENTIKLVNAMGNAAYSSDTGTSTTENYAAKVCNDFVSGGYDDWYLPTSYELFRLLHTLVPMGIGGFAGNYWSSNEDVNYINSVHFYSVDNGAINGARTARSACFKVRAVRAFL